MRPSELSGKIWVISVHTTVWFLWLLPYWQNCLAICSIIWSLAAENIRDHRAKSNEREREREREMIGISIPAFLYLCYKAPLPNKMDPGVSRLLHILPVRKLTTSLKKEEKLERLKGGIGTVNAVFPSCWEWQKSPFCHKQIISHFMDAFCSRELLLYSFNSVSQTWICLQTTWKSCEMHVWFSWSGWSQILHFYKVSQWCQSMVYISVARIRIWYFARLSNS